MEENKVCLQGLTFFCTEHQVLTKGTLVFDTFSLAFVFNPEPRASSDPGSVSHEGRKLGQLKHNALMN